MSKLCFPRPVLVRSSPRIYDAFSPSFMQTPPCSIICAEPCGADLGKLVVMSDCRTCLEKKVPLELMKETGSIGSSNGWVATLKEDGILRLQDDLNPAASYTDPKRISLPPLVTLPRCQTKIVTNVSMSSSSPEDDDCVVAVKFLGPQVSFCRPSRRNYGWINVRMENPCFYSSRVMFSKKDDMFRIPGSGGHLIASWDLHKHKHLPKLQSLRFRKLPKLPKATREILDWCCTSEHLVDSPSTGETFLVKCYRFAVPNKGTSKMKTIFFMVFKLDEQGNAVYTKDIGDLTIFLSKSEPFSVPAGSFPGLRSNEIIFYDIDETGFFFLEDSTIHRCYSTFRVPYHIPPQPVI